MDFSYLEMEMYTKDAIKMENLMERANTFGLMDLPTLANLLMDRDQDKENGYRVFMMEIYISETTKKIENREKENIYGLQGVFLKAIF